EQKEAKKVAKEKKKAQRNTPSAFALQEEREKRAAAEERERKEKAEALAAELAAEREAKTAAEEEARREQLEREAAGETTCIICFSNAKSHVAGPCGHLCACGPCSAKMESCPICRAPVLMWMQLRVA
ncbi:hypothetical protein EMIHUDRAFT_247499, partial [Emiliania huxleyi CCMP1516]|uniref:RING-type domain-containing protein n=2 Tax=Emiliania huxleyi TaxID=2903 RepID=A0A0D3IM02_EMIH1